MYLPTAVSLAVGVLVAGPMTSRIGYYTPVMVVGSVLMIIATGLFTTFTPSMPSSQWIPYQVVYGIGVGMAFQQPYIAVQTVLAESKVATGLMILSFTQQIGGIVALAIAQNMFTNSLMRNLARDVPGLNPSIVLKHGTLKIMNAVPKQYVDEVKVAFNNAVVDVLYLALALTCVTFFGALFIEWKSVRKEKVESQKKEKDDAIQLVEMLRDGERIQQAVPSTIPERQ